MRQYKRKATMAIMKLIHIFFSSIHLDIPQYQSLILDRSFLYPFFPSPYEKSKSERLLLSPTSRSYIFIAQNVSGLFLFYFSFIWENELNQINKLNHFKTYIISVAIFHFHIPQTYFKLNIFILFYSQPIMCTV